MKKSTIIEVIVIIGLAIILGILLKYTIDVIDENHSNNMMNKWR